MKRLAIIFSLLILTGGELLAQGIKLLEDKSWKEIKAIAARENKMIFLDAYATWCGPCKYMQQYVFTSPEAGEYFNANFINVKIDMEKGEGPELAEKFGLTAYPTLFFFSPEGKLLHKYIGALDTEDFIALAKEAQQPENQFYTLKDKAIEGKLSPENFHKWIHTANDFGEEDVISVTSNYLEKVNDLTNDKHLAIIILDHAPLLTSKQMQQLNQKADKLALLLGVSKDDILSRLNKKEVYKSHL